MVLDKHDSLCGTYFKRSLAKMKNQCGGIVEGKTVYVENTLNVNNYNCLFVAYSCMFYPDNLWGRNYLIVNAACILKKGHFKMTLTLG